MKQPLEDFAIREAGAFLKSVSEGLKSLAKGVETLARQVDSLAESQTTRRENPKASEKPPQKKTAKPSAPPRSRRNKAPKPASDTVFKLIQQSKEGVTTAELAAETGFNTKKVQNSLYRLKRKGSIRTIRKGVYVAA